MIIGTCKKRANQTPSASKSQIQAKKGSQMATNLRKTVKTSFALAVVLLGSTGFLIANTSTPSYARERECEAQFSVNGGSTQWLYLEKVGGFLKNKKKKCLEAATNYAQKTLRVEDIPGIDVEKTKQAVCNQKEQGGIEVDVNTDVDGKVNSRNGKTRSMLNVGC